MRKEIINEIKDAIVTLLQDEIVIGFNFPVEKGLEVVWEGIGSISNALQNMPYHQKYALIRANKSFSLILHDESIIQMLYETDATDTEIVKHRLCFFPTSNAYFDDTELYNYFESSYARFISHREYCIIPSIRIDFAPKQYTINHPNTHLHIGEIEFFRLPVERPLSPVDFLNFILLNVYQYKNPLKRHIASGTIVSTLTGNESNKSIVKI